MSSAAPATVPPLSTPLCPRYLAAARQPADIIPLSLSQSPRRCRHAPRPALRSQLVITYHSDIIRQKSLLGLYRPLLHWLLRRADRIVVATPPQLEHSAVLPASATAAR